MSSAEDLELLKETFQFILDKTKDQDVIYFFRDLSANTKSKRLLSHFFRDNYQVVSAISNVLI
jgi:aminopeptidase 2